MGTPVHKHLLVIRLSAMGDVAMTVPVLRALQEQHPNCTVTVLTRSFFAPMFAQLPQVSVFTADVKGRHKGILGLWRLYRALKQLGITEVVDLHAVLRSTILKGFFKFGSTPFFGIDKGRSDKKALTAPKKKVFARLKSTHERYATVFGKAGYPISLQKTHVLEKEALSTAARTIAENRPRKWIGVAPFAAHEGKQYPLELMKKALAALQQQVGCTLFLFGGGKKEQLLLDTLVGDTDRVNVTGKLSFADELSLISNLDGMVAMDSGNAHLAAMYGVPVVTLWGVTHPFAGFYPFGQPDSLALLADREQFPLIPTSVYGNKVPEGYENAIKTIGTEAIVQKVRAMLELS